MPLKEKSKVVLFLGAIAIIIILLMSSSNVNIFTMSSVDYGTGIDPSKINNCATKSEKWDSPITIVPIPLTPYATWIGMGAPGTGYPFKELLTDTKYITSFKSSGVAAYSERISLEANVYTTSFWQSWYPDKAYYNVYLSTDGTNWRKIVGLGMADSTIVQVTGGVGYKDISGYQSWQNKPVWCPNMEIQIIGPYVGVLKAEAVIHFTTTVGGGVDGVFATDYAYLISGSGKINVKGYQDYDIPMFENGDTVTVQVKADYSGQTAGGTGRWELWAYPPSGSGQLIKSWAYDNFREEVAWKLPDNAWVRGMPNSKWRIELHNTLFSTDAIMVNTIDVKANAPPTPSISISPSKVIQGEEITLTITGNTNKITNESLLRYDVILRYVGASEPYLEKNVSVKGLSDPYLTTTTFMAPDTGQLVLLVISHDAAGRETVVPAKMMLTVSPEGTNPDGFDLLAGDINLIILAILIVIIVVGIVFYVLQTRGKGRKRK
jgi:hypothetical protein